MICHLPRWFFFFSTGLLLFPLMVYTDPGLIEYQAEAYRTFASIEIDGDFNEADWQNAKPLNQFSQVEPDPGAPITQPTEVRILYDEKNIYFGFTCFDSDISRLVANEMRRDARELHENDYVFLILDTYNDRRSLFFPEKRPFFLEGAGLFDFGVPRTSFRRPPPLLLFYSRRIGIEEGHAVPLIAGGKITGKVGPYGVGLLNVLTDAFHTDESVTDPDEIVDVPRTDYSVLRLTRDIFSGSRIGLIAINKQKDSDTYNRAGGLDFSYRPDDQLGMRGLWARTSDSENTTGQKDAWYIGSDWRNDLFRLEGSYTDIGDGFNPEVGFVRRTGSRRLRSEMRYAPRIRRFGIREIQVGPELDYILTQENDLETRDIVLGGRLELDSGARIRLQAQQTKERLDEAFDIRGDVIIPIGEYEFTSFRASVETDESNTSSRSKGY